MSKNYDVLGLKCHDKILLIAPDCDDAFGLFTSGRRIAHTGERRRPRRSQKCRRLFAVDCVEKNLGYRQRIESEPANGAAHGEAYATPS